MIATLKNIIKKTAATLCDGFLSEIILLSARLAFLNVDVLRVTAQDEEGDRTQPDAALKAW